MPLVTFSLVYHRKGRVRLTLESTSSLVYFLQQVFGCGGSGTSLSKNLEVKKGL